MEKIKKIFYIFLPLVLGIAVSFIIKDNIDYEYLLHPMFAPPAIIFPIVWTILYLLMGISFYIYKINSDDDKNINSIYYTQLFFNLMWSIIFFNLKFRFIGTIWIITLDFLVIYLIRLFFSKNKISAYLNIPYLIWLLFASYLTFSIYLLN